MSFDPALNWIIWKV